MSLAVPNDVVIRMGRDLATFSTAQVQQIEMLLEDAEAMLIARIPALFTQINLSTSPVTLPNVIRIEAAAVRRVMLNPGAFGQETIDGWTGVRTAALADGLLYFTDEEWAVLLPTIGVRKRGSVLMIANGEIPGMVV